MKAIITPSPTRVLLGFSLLGVILAVGGFYLSWRSVEEEHRERSSFPSQQGQLLIQSSPSALKRDSGATDDPSAVSSGGIRENPVLLGGDSSATKDADLTGDPCGSDTEADASDGIALPPAIFNATKHPELTDIPPDVIERLAQEFVEKVKEGGWDNTSEAYRKNWEKAVEEVNETFKAAYGYDAYLKLTSGGTN